MSGRAFSEWFSNSSELFGHQSPEQWFHGRDLSDLSEIALTLSKVPLETGGIERERRCVLERPPEEVMPSILEAIELQRTFNLLGAVDKDLRGLLRRFKFAPIGLSSDAQAVLKRTWESIISEVERLLPLYDEAARTGEEDFAGAVYLCLKELLRRGPGAYSSWYFVEQHAFAGIPPNSWLTRRGNYVAAGILQSFIENVGSNEEVDWVFVIDADRRVELKFS